MGFTSAGEEYERFRPQEEDGPAAGSGWNDLDHVFTRLRGTELSRSWRERRDACSCTGVEGGVRGEARTSNWRER